VVPFRPNSGVHVRLSPIDAADAAASLSQIPGVAGMWTLAGDDRSPEPLRSVTARWCWLDRDPHELAPGLAGADDDSWFSATFAAVDPWGRWDWFDG
jgi:hypothetical protein